MVCILINDNIHHYSATNFDHSDVRYGSIVCTLIDNNKLANHIATLLPIVIKTQSGI